MQDILSKEILINKPLEVVYDLVSNPGKISLWFPDSIEGDLNVGQLTTLIFGEHGKSSIYVVDAKPRSYFAFRWVPGSGGIEGDVTKVPNTLVEFSLTETDQGTKLCLTESGFATLPADIAQSSFDQNSGGWDYMLAKLQKAAD
jgi:uncharacterized protein YndB with AHSA1/START domain